MTEIEITSQTGVNVYVSEWDDGGLWIRLGLSNGSIYTSLNREQAEQMLQSLQTILAKEVTA
jgi:hypothetical protein